jgi:hypothetical protein
MLARSAKETLKTRNCAISIYKLQNNGQFSFSHVVTFCVSTAFPRLPSIQHQASSFTIRSKLLYDFIPSHTESRMFQSLFFGSEKKTFLSYFCISKGWYKVSFDLTAEIFNDTLGKDLTRVIPCHSSTEQRCKPGFQMLRHGIPGQPIWATWQ